MRNIWINELYTEVQSMSTFHTRKSPPPIMFALLY